MYFKRVFTESLAHYSYVIGDKNQLIVIDPQPETDIYLDISLKTGKSITSILETHRNEDFLAGSKALSDLTGAKVYISDEKDLDYQYGERIVDGQEIALEDITIKAIHTPGHTLGHMAYLLSYKDNPHMVFVGDLFFYGDVGRIDFYGKENLNKMASLLYDSIFNKILPLGDNVIMWPAHGTGSVCGESIESRTYSTLGYERKHNPKLQYNNKAAFIKANAKMLFKPDYFKYMERVNLIGIDSIDCKLKLAYKNIDEIGKDVIIDVRDQNAFNKAHILNSIWIKKENILNFINWVVDRESDITLVTSLNDNRKAIIKNLLRIGYTGNISFLIDGIDELYKYHHNVASVEVVYPKDYLENIQNYFILDVRKTSEAKVNYNGRGILIPIEEISSRYKELENKSNILVVCPSGIRSNIVVSYLKSKNINAKLLIGGLDLLT